MNDSVKKKSNQIKGKKYQLNFSYHVTLWGSQRIYIFCIFFFVIIFFLFCSQTYNSKQFILPIFILFSAVVFFKFFFCFGFVLTLSICFHSAHREPFSISIYAISVFLSLSLFIRSNVCLLIVYTLIKHLNFVFSLYNLQFLFVKIGNIHFFIISFYCCCFFFSVSQKFVNQSFNRLCLKKKIQFLLSFLCFFPSTKSIQKKKQPSKSDYKL